MKVALLGFPQSGKKTFFKLLTGRGRGASGLPALKPGETLEGIALIHDARVDALATIFKPEKTKYAENHSVCEGISYGNLSRNKRTLTRALHLSINITIKIIIENTC